MVRRSWLLAVALATGMLHAADARGDDDPISIALYAPWSGPTTADDRHALALEIQRAVEGAGVGRVTVSTYAKLADFKRELATQHVDVALVDCGATSFLGKRLAVRASWSSGQRWVLAGTSAHDRLHGLRLALQAPDAPSSKRMVTRLLRGMVAGKYWGEIVGAPVTDDARQVVLRGRADVVLVPERLATGMTELASVGSFSELALAVDDTRPAVSEAVELVQQAARKRLGGSWTKGAPQLPRAVGSPSFISAPVTTDTPSFLDLLSSARTVPPELDLDDMWMDPNAP